jgi:hypothetical protein
MGSYVYRHQYHQTLTYKIFHAWKSKPEQFVSFAQALELIRLVHDVTGGIAQIVYLVGWQYDGHDSRYPSWGEVNPRLKRPEDADAAESLRWLMREAKVYNATVSLHINMCDAYPDSPLWDEYMQRDLLNRNADGTLMLGGIWDGAQSYLVSKTREWRSGFAQRRIDALVAMLPLTDAGTVHIDVFRPCPSPYHGVSFDDEVAAMLEILHYWHSLGIDVTQEWFHHEFAGLVPMVYHLNLDEAGRLRYPPDVICGGGSAWNKRHWVIREDEHVWMSPELGCLYEEAWGHSMAFDLATPEQVPDFADMFFTRTLPWTYLNRQTILRHEHTRESYDVQFTDDVRTTVRTADRHFRITRGDEVLMEDGDVCLPAPWLGQACLAYSRTGGQRTWPLPADWQGVQRVDIRRLLPMDTARMTTAAVCDGAITLNLQPGEAVCVQPA